MLIQSLVNQLTFHIILNSLEFKKNQLDTHSDSIKTKPVQRDYQHAVHICFRL